MIWCVPEVQEKGWPPHASCGFCGNSSFPYSRVKRSDTLKLQDGPIGFPVTNRQPTTRNTPEERRPHILSARQSELQSFPCFAFAGCFLRLCTKRLLVTVRLTVNKTSGFSSYAPSVSWLTCLFVNSTGHRGRAVVSLRFVDDEAPGLVLGSDQPRGLVVRVSDY